MGTHFNNLLLLFLLRLFAAPRLSLFLGGHCGDRWHRPDLSAAGHRQGIWPRGRRKRTRASAAAAAPHGKQGAHSPPKRGLCDRSLLQSIVGSGKRRPEAELRVRFCRGRPGGGREGTWENALASLVMSVIHLVLSRLCWASGSMGRGDRRPLRFGPPFTFFFAEDGRFFCPACSVNGCPYHPRPE